MKVIDPGFAVTVQDLGRKGYQHFGVSVAGAMDGFALMAANHLVGNPIDFAGLETALAGFQILTDMDCVVAGAGRGFDLVVDDNMFPLWSSVLVKRGQTVQLRANAESGWGYLAMSGGIQVSKLLGSSATYLPGKWPGLSSRILLEKDELTLGMQPDPYDLILLSGRRLPTGLIPQYGNSMTIRFVSMNGNGPNDKGIPDQFQDQTYRIENTSRMAYRLAGNPIPICGTADILSEGVGAGVIQLLGSGQPLVLMRDAQTTGGYRKLGAVISADLDVLAQCTGQQAEIRFRAIPVDEAQSLWRKKIASLLSLDWSESQDS
jgi:antagonist of KipI